MTIARSAIAWQAPHVEHSNAQLSASSRSRTDTDSAPEPQTAIEWTGEILDRLQDPVLLIDQECRIIYRNGAAARALSAKSALAIQSGKLSVLPPADKTCLSNLIAASSTGFRRHNSRGLRLARRTATKDWLLIVSPLPGQSTSTVFVVHLISRLFPRQLPAAALRDLFGLSRKEINVLEGLVRSESLHDIAKRMNLSHETVRAYVKRIFRKCDVRSQTQLLALLQKVSLLA